MAITQASSLADFSTGIGTAGAVLKVDNADGRVGIGTTDPQADLQVGIAITMDGTSGAITASSFSGSGANLTFTGADISAATGTFTGNVSVGGTLTYEDVTNIDAVGIITARSGVRVTGGNIQAGDSSTGFSGTVISGFSTTTSGNAGTIQAKNFGSGGANFVGFDAAGNDTARILADGGALFASDVSIADKIIHTGDTNTAIRFPAADTFTVETGGSERLRVDSGGDVGIGTATVDNTLHVYKSGDGQTPVFFETSNGTEGELRFYNDSNGWSLDSGGDLRFVTSRTGSGAPTRLKIDSSGRVLIGTETEGEASADDLTVATSGNTGITIRSGTSNSGNLFFSDGTSGNNEIRGYVQYLHASNALLLGADASERFRINSEGYITVSGPTDYSNIQFKANGTVRGYVGPDGFLGGSDTDFGVRSESGGAIVFRISSTEKARLNSGGNFLVGTTTADGFKFKVLNGAGTIARFTDGTSQTLDIRQASGGIELQNPNNGFISFKGSSDERMRIASNGVITAKAGAIAEIDTLTSASTVTPDFAASCNFTLTLGHDVTLANPSNLTAGQSGSIFLVQDGTGSRTISFGSYYDFAGGTAPTLSTAASSVDRLDYFVRTSSSIHCVVTLAYS